MKTRIWIAGTIALCALAAAASRGAEGMTRLDASPGKDMKVRLEGTSSIHDWQAEGTIISGFLEVGPGFPLTPGQSVTPGKVPVHAEAFIPVRSLKSIEKDGSPYSEKMDAFMYEDLKSPPNLRIIFRVSELTLKEAPKAPDAPYVFEAKGELVVAGVTNTISFPVNVTPLGDQKFKVTGSTSLKMTDFHIKPRTLIGILSTGDDVKIQFVWPLIQKKPEGTTK